MTPTKELQAQEYAEKKMHIDYPSMPVCDFFMCSLLFRAYDIQQAYLDGYTAAEQSMWRSVEDELTERLSGVTLRPSVGNFGLPCKSHYFITDDKIEWL